MGQARGGVGMYHHCRQVRVGLHYCDLYSAVLYVDQYIVIHIQLDPWQLYVDRCLANTFRQLWYGT